MNSSLDTSRLVTLLDRPSKHETNKTSQLRLEATQILRKEFEDISPSDNPSSTPSTQQASHLPTPLPSPSTLEDLLTKVIKPLFAPIQHHALTPSGRVAPASRSSIPDHFTQSYNLFDEDSEARAKPWKALVTTSTLHRQSWPISLLSYILKSYVNHPPQVLNSQIHLVTPAILHLIDDASIKSKSQGCQLLYLLADTAYSMKSDILAKTGLVDVFIDALRPNFMLLPTLTPEDESLAILQELYPAYLRLVDAATTPTTPDSPSKKPSPNPSSLPPSPSKDQRPPSIPTHPTTLPTQPTLKSDPFPFLNIIHPDPKSKSPKPSLKPTTPAQKRYSYLTHLLRHALLPSLSHLQITPTASTGSLSTTSLPLSIFLIGQIPPIAKSMGLAFVMHLQTIIPLLGNVLRDPFSLFAPTLAKEAMSAMQSVAEVCADRIGTDSSIDPKETQNQADLESGDDNMGDVRGWWTDILAAVVSCWINTVEELEDFPLGEFSRSETSSSSSWKKDKGTEGRKMAVVEEISDDDDEDGKYSRSSGDGDQRKKEPQKDQEKNERRMELLGLQNECRVLMGMLKSIVGKEKFAKVQEQLIREDEDLRGLFRQEDTRS